MSRWKRSPSYLTGAIAMLFGVALAFLVLAEARASNPAAPTAPPTRFLPADWDARSVRKPAVIQESSSFRMWFEGEDYWNTFHMGLAASTDGLTWSKESANPVLSGDAGAWDEFGERSPFVLFQEGVYHMWYEGSDGSVRQLGYAASPDGINWTKYAGNPVLEAGPETYDQIAAGHGTVLFEDHTYKLWYHAIGDLGAIIAYATSDTTTSWTKHGVVLGPTPGFWDEGGVWGPSVLKDGATYWMWFSGFSSSFPASIGVATSPDGVSWSKVGGVPVITIPENEIGDPSVIKDGDTFKMWFTNFTDGKIYYTTSTDGLDWSSPVEALTPGLMEPMVGNHDGPAGDVGSMGCGASGWVADPDVPTRTVTVQVLADGALVEESPANQYRDDLDPTVCPSGNCGYAVNLWGKITAGAPHEIIVQAYDVESGDWWGLGGTPKNLTCWGYVEGSYDGPEGDVRSTSCSAFGWAADPDVPTRTIDVQVLVDGLLVEEVETDQPRPDVDPLICPNGTCGFAVDLWGQITAGVPHSVTVQAFDEELSDWRVLGEPRNLTCWGYPEGAHDGESGTVAFPACNAFGWAVDPDEPDRDLDVRVLVDDSPAATTIANELREDVSACPGGTCGFHFDLWSLLDINVPHEIVVQAYDEETTAWMDLSSEPYNLICTGGRIWLPLVVRE